MSIQTTYNETPAIAFAGSIVGKPGVIVPMTNDEASAEIAFGLAVAFNTGGPHDQSARLPAAETDKVWGIVVKSDRYARAYTVGGETRGELGETGLVPGVMMNVLRRGTIWVVAQKAVAVGDRLWVRAVAGGGEVLGGLENADDGTDMIDCTAQGVWVSSASAGQLAQLEVDFTNKP